MSCDDEDTLSIFFTKNKELPLPAESIVDFPSTTCANANKLYLTIVDCDNISNIRCSLDMNAIEISNFFDMLEKSTKARRTKIKKWHILILFGDNMGNGFKIPPPYTYENVKFYSL